MARRRVRQRRLILRRRSLHRELRSAFGGRAGAEDPPLRFLDGDVVDASLPAAHQAVLVELPELVAIAAPPLPLSVMALVLEPDRDPVFPEGPQVLAQGIVELAVPLADEEVDDRRPSSAACTLARALRWSNGGSGGRSVMGALLALSLINNF